jgi:Zn-dependent M28 family amino/carboxypeptidase
MNNKIKLLLITIIGLAALALAVFALPSSQNETQSFDGERAYDDIRTQLAFGPRIPGSEAHLKTVNWIIESLKKSGWKVETQEIQENGIPIKNIIAKRGMGEPWIILGSHYDTREFADRDKSVEGKSQPVMGANDGASSTAILLEIARIVPEKINGQVWLVFFDAEDISGNVLALGSQQFVNSLESKPESVVILDMVGDSDLNIPMEKNSNPELMNEIWEVASELGYTQFIPAYKYGILDDHTPFVRAGIRAVDIIDFDYPYWHTTQDTLDKVSAESLTVVGRTVIEWLNRYIK